MHLQYTEWASEPHDALVMLRKTLLFRCATLRHSLSLQCVHPKVTPLLSNNPKTGSRLVIKRTWAFLKWGIVLHALHTTPAQTSLNKFTRVLGTRAPTWSLARPLIPLCDLCYSSVCNRKVLVDNAPKDIVRSSCSECPGTPILDINY